MDTRTQKKVLLYILKYDKCQASGSYDQSKTNKQTKNQSGLNSQPKGQKFGGVTRIPLFVPNQLCFPAEELYSQEKKQSHLKISLHLTGQGTTQKMKVNNKNSYRIMIITITKIIYLYIRQKNVLSTNLWNKNKSPKIKKKPHFGNIEYNGIEICTIVFCI